MRTSDDSRLRPAVWRVGGYLMAILSVAAAVGIALLLKEHVDASPALLVAVMLVTWFFGAGPGALAVLASTVAIDYYFLGKLGRLALNFDYLPRLAFFTVSAFIVAWLSAARKNAEGRLNLERAQLELIVQRRTAELHVANQSLREEVVERTRAEQSARDRADLLDLTHDTMMVRDSADVITYWNRGAEAMYGWTEKEALGRVSHELLRTVFPASLEQIKASLAATGRWEGELVHVAKDGHNVQVASRWALKRDASGNPLEMLEINNDISEQRKAEQAARDAEERLMRSGRISAMGELAASIAHEVNQPLTGVVTNANAALRWLSAPTPNLREVTEAIDRIVRDGGRAAQIIARIRAMMMNRTLERTRVEVNSVVREVVALNHLHLLRSKVALDLKLAGELLAFHGDRVQIEQVVLNLVRNATEAMASTSEADRRLSISTGRDDTGNIILCVGDSGPGIDPAALDRLFEPFFTTKLEGMGMGLSICRSIIRAHGGRISVNSSPGLGAEFVICLPATAAGAVSA